jgi:hypothetical protein
MRDILPPTDPRQSKARIAADPPSVPVVQGPALTFREVASDSDETAPESHPSVPVVQGPALTSGDVASDSDETVPESHPSVPVEQVTAFFRDSFKNFALFLAERTGDVTGGPDAKTVWSFTSPDGRKCP